MTLEQRLTALATTVAARFNALPHFVGMPGYCLNPDNIPTDWLVLDGSAIVRANYTLLDTAIYCGDANNATAQWGYRCGNSDGTGRSTTGAYLVLPDDRDRYTRGWREGGGYDLWTYYEDEIKAHNHDVRSVGSSSGSGSGLVRNSSGNSQVFTSNYITETGGLETRPRTALKIPIIYAGPA